MNLQRFHMICDAIEPDERGCRVWPMCRTAAGYPQLDLSGRHAYGHRLALERKLGRPIATGLSALHECDVRACVEQSHLVEGTQLKNIRDAVSRGRALVGDLNGSRTKPERRPKGERNGLSKITSDQALRIVSDSEAGLSQRSIARVYGIGQQTVCDILSGKNWGHVTGIKKRV